MGSDLSVFEDKQLDADYFEWLVEERSVEIQKHFNKFWEYYTNRAIDISRTGVDRTTNKSGRCYIQAQEYGLPARITGFEHCAEGGIFGTRAVKDVQRKEVVIENDIAWRINAAVDFLFGKPISFVSRSSDSRKRAEIESILKAVFSANGGIGASPARIWLAILVAAWCERVAVNLFVNFFGLLADALKYHADSVGWRAFTGCIDRFYPVFYSDTSRLIF